MTAAGVERREFLRILAGAGLAAGSGGWLADRLWALQLEDRLPYRTDAPLEAWTTTLCSQCPGGCSLRVRSCRGLPVRLAGNPHWPVNRGGVCPLGSAGLQWLYHPDRLRQPLRRLGERGEGRWQPLSWNQALGILQQRLQNLRQQNEAQRLVVVADRRNDTQDLILGRFMKAFGSPNLIDADGPDLGRQALHLATGAGRPPAYDLANASFVLSFGFDYLEAHGAPVWQIRTFGDRRTSSPLERGTFVQIEPRLSATAAKADRWLSVRPGTEGVVALAIAHQLVREERYDHDFVERHTFGFEDWTDSTGGHHLGFRSLLLEEYAPEAAAQIAGVAAADIVAIAHEYGRHPKSVAIAGPGTTGHTNGLQTLLAVQSLNALTGQVGRPGGVLTAPVPALQDLPPFVPDEVARHGHRQPPLTRSASGGSESIGILLDQMAAGRPYPVDTLLVAGVNPLFERPDPQQVKHALDGVEFIVSFATLLDETAEYADLVLPTPTFLESWGDAASVPGVPWPHAVVQQPVVTSLYDTRNPGDVLVGLARGLGDGTARAFPQADVESILRQRYRGLFASGRGQVAGPYPVPVSSFVDFDAFWQALLAGGGWYDEVEYSEPRFDTPSGRFEFYARSQRDDPALQHAADDSLLPHFQVPQFQGDANSYPYHLCLFDTNTLFGGRGASLPLMMEMAGFRHDVEWDSWLEINPITADRHGIKTGEMVWIESEIGQLQVRAMIWEGVPPDMVAMPVGLGHEAGGRYCQGRGSSPNPLVHAVTSYLDGTTPRLATRVRIGRVNTEV